MLRNQTGRLLPAFTYPDPVERLTIDGPYDLFFAVMMGIPDLDVLESCIGWRKRSKVAVCWIDEIWLRNLGSTARLKTLEKFDFVFVACEATIPSLEEAIGRPCSYIAPGIDALSFCPYPKSPDRTIDVYSIGRRSEAHHQALIELARERKLHYVFDSAPVRCVHNTFEHRLLLASQIQRSRFFCVDVAKANVPGHRGEQEEMGYRFFEGAAGGALLVGRPPQSDSFNQNFDWAGAVIKPPDSPSDWGDFVHQYAEGPQTE